ncbi:cell division protein ZapE [Vibrio sp. WXL103]|uniref:cell division protein ZapE n=1 Tax=unclassified Vibrio TaxID=2614977 RepID=UPI003EC7600A
MVVQSPQERYQHDVAHNGFVKDAAQSVAIKALDRLFFEYQQYISYTPEPQSLIDKLLGRSPVTPPAPQGLYLWGGVGRGKTYLMDTFFHALTNPNKLRVHFHRFMYRVHDDLKALGEVEDPLEIVADQIASETDIICFDEFYVSDITDAMILAGLFNALFARGIILVATSNIAPKDLYRNGLQRARFLPTIALIEAHCQILNVDSGTDFRLRTLEQAEIYHAPLDAQADINLERYFAELTVHCTPDEHEQVIEVNHRQLEVVASCEGVLFATFEQLCLSARSQNDYIELSRLYHTVLLKGVTQMGANNDDAARRFIALVDEFYERNVTLIISAEVVIDALYTQGRLSFEFARCQSRLIEMQSHDYLAREHLG